MGGGQRFRLMAQKHRWADTGGRNSGHRDKEGTVCVRMEWGARERKKKRNYLTISSPTLFWVYRRRVVTN